MPTHWDPFEDTVTVTTTEPSAKAPKGLPIPPWVGQLGMLVAVAACLGIVGTFLGLVSDETALTVVVPMFIGGFIVVMVSDKFGSAERRRDWGRARTIHSLGWSYRPMVSAERRQRMQARLQEFFTLRVGASLPLMVEEECWGDTDSGIPFWLGLQSADMAVVANPTLSRDAHGGEGATGRWYSLVAAYPIDRKTGIRLALLPEGLVGGGDVETESIAFNNAFHITVSGGDKADEQRRMADMLQALTPATQTTLMDLAQRYWSFRMVIDDDTVFVGGQERLMGESADPARLASNFQTVLADFTTAMVGFKRYVE